MKLEEAIPFFREGKIIYHRRTCVYNGVKENFEYLKFHKSSNKIFSLSAETLLDGCWEVEE